MSHPRLHRRLMSAALTTSLALAGVGCNGAMRDEELALGEAASFITASEEGGEIGADAVALADGAQLSALAEEQAALSTEVPESVGDVCDLAARRERVLAAYDTDKDGRLDRAELRALREDLAPGVRARFFGLGWRVRMWAFSRVRWAFDENGDHALSDEERSALVDAMTARCERLRTAVLETFDANGDGTLDEAERQAARDAFRAKLLARRQEVLDTYDANRSGTLEQDEREALRADRLQAAKARRAALMEHYDTNGDGRLSAEEALPLRKAIQDRIRNGEDAE
jgi:Ca2+-binding EF-hand superfamily protein